MKYEIIHEKMSELLALWEGSRKHYYPECALREDVCGGLFVDRASGTLPKIESRSSKKIQNDLNIQDVVNTVVRCATYSTCRERV